MQKILCILFMLLSFSAFATKEWDNNVCIKGWGSVTFSTIDPTKPADKDKFKVTTGQPFSGIKPNNQPSEKNCQRVRSGRQNSVAVMNWADKEIKRIIGVPPDSNYDQIPVPAKYFYNEYGEDKFDYIIPAEANFMVIVDITLSKNPDYPGLEVICRNVIFGQTGHYTPYKGGKDLVTGNIWLVYPQHAAGNEHILCTNQYGNVVKLEPFPGARIKEPIEWHVRPKDIDEDNTNYEGNDGMSAFGSANDDNTFEFKVVP